MVDYLESGKDIDIDYYRRPGIIRGPEGILLAYYEGQRMRLPKKQTLIIRRSTDGGRTWGDRRIICQGGDTGMLHNMMMVYDGTRIHCLWNVQYRQLWHTSSEDGENWSTPIDLTRQLWRAECSYEWNAFGIGSGHGIVLRNGRILIPTWFTTGGDGHKPSGFGNIYTDDGFATVHIGAVLEKDDCHENILNPNEGAIVELDNGEVLATVRHDCEMRMRAFAVSDGGVGAWSEVVYREDLPDPICHASLLRIGENILFSNCANPDEGALDKIRRGKLKYNWSDDARKNLTIRFSKDEGGTFSNGILIAEKAGYCDMADTEDEVVCVFETGWNEEETCIFPRQLGIARIAIDDLKDGC